MQGLKARPRRAGSYCWLRGLLARPPASSLPSKPRPSSSLPVAPVSPGSSRRTPGKAPATVTPWHYGRAPISSTWSACSFTRPAWSGPSRCAVSSLPRVSVVTEACCATLRGERFMFNYVADMFRAETADSEEEADKWYDDHSAGRRPPELLPRDEVARAINAEVKAGRGSPHGGVFLDIASRRTPEFIRRRLPSMYHTSSWKLAGVDITREAMEIGPTCHYIMGGVQVDAESQETAAPRTVRRWRVWWAVCTVRTDLVATRFPTSLCLESVLVPGLLSTSRPARAPRPSNRAKLTPRSKKLLSPLTARRVRTPYTVQHELQEMMQGQRGALSARRANSTSRL